MLVLSILRTLTDMIKTTLMITRDTLSMPKKQEQRTSDEPFSGLLYNKTMQCVLIKI